MDSYSVSKFFSKNLSKHSIILKYASQNLISKKWFEFAITGVIIFNSILIGIETYQTTSLTTFIQDLILYVFTIEICLRFMACNSPKSFFSSGWNVLDFTLVIAGYIPDTLFVNASSLLALRIVRILRVLRLLGATKEIKRIIDVLLKSTSAVFYNVLLFIIFIYLFAILGVGLFRLPKPESLPEDQQHAYAQLIERSTHVTPNTPDPFGTLGEAMFTLFRELTGDDWTAIRYDHITAYETGLLKTPPLVINTYHILWFVISAFLLLNLVTGAIISNYQQVMEKTNTDK